MEKMLVKITDARFTTTKNLKLDVHYPVMYQDEKNYFIQDGGIVQEVPKTICEVKTVNLSVANKRLMFG
jgi:hypothetical protein